MSCAPSGATPIVSTTPSGGERSCPLPVRGYPSWRESHMESRRGEKSGQRLYSARPEQGFSIEGPRPCALSLELPEAERSGEAYRRSLSHDCTIASSPLAELDACLDRMAAPILYEGKNPILIRFAPKHISGTSCDGEGVCIFRSLVTTSPRIWWENVLEESFLNFSRVTERFS